MISHDNLESTPNYGRLDLPTLRSEQPSSVTQILRLWDSKDCIALQRLLSRNRQGHPLLWSCRSLRLCLQWRA